MEGFIAAFSKDRAPLNSGALATALTDIRQASNEVTAYSWSDDVIAFACLTRNLYSDADIIKPQAHALVYTDGTITELDTTATSNISPAGVYLKAAQAWAKNVDQIAKLSGSFYGLYYDLSEQRAIITTDRLSSRPLFYYDSPTTLYVASDIRPLLHLVRPLTLDLEAVALFVRYQTLLDTRTLYSQIKTLPPACVLDYSAKCGSVKMSCYWSFTPLELYRTRTEAIEATAEVFKEATERLSKNSRNLGVFLSGGLDSRMLIAGFDTAQCGRTQAYTFGSAVTDEVETARDVAREAGIGWHMLNQSLDTYMANVQPALRISNGLYCGAHTHLFYPASEIQSQGVDTILEGWGLDLLFSGSYFPKESFDLFGRTLYSYRLQPLRSVAETFTHLHDSLDMHFNNPRYSLCGERFRSYWHEAPPAALRGVLSTASQQSDSPYDWIDYTLFGFNIAKFRSYTLPTNTRAYLRERNPLFESDVLEVYQRLPYQWRFLGPIFRRALNKLNPAITAISYSNVGTSVLAPAIVQAVTMQLRQAGRANMQRLDALQRRVRRQPPTTNSQKYGGYIDATEMALYLQDTTPTSRQLHALITQGPLVESGLLDPTLLSDALERCRGGSGRAGVTIMAWVSLALWLEMYPQALPDL